MIQTVEIREILNLKTVQVSKRKCTIYQYLFLISCLLKHLIVQPKNMSNETECVVQSQEKATDGNVLENFSKFNNITPTQNINDTNKGPRYLTEIESSHKISDNLTEINEKLKNLNFMTPMAVSTNNAWLSDPLLLLQSPSILHVCREWCFTNTPLASLNVPLLDPLMSEQTSMISPNPQGAISSTMKAPFVSPCGDVPKREAPQRSTNPFQFGQDPNSFQNFVNREQKTFCQKHNNRSAGSFHKKEVPGNKNLSIKNEFRETDDFLRDELFQQVQNHILQMATHVFANWVLQLFFQFGHDSYVFNKLTLFMFAAGNKEKAVNALIGNILSLSFNIYACRVVQTALAHVNFNLKSQILKELQGHIVECVQNSNAHHVVEHILKVCPPELSEFVISEMTSELLTLSNHTYGCQTIEKLLQKFDLNHKHMVCQ
ncbi:hypothetical protein RFI_17602 [Reticulomyxa filosa]|uniref:PUM-HD domain-containing protein n=1 Tax=Reticulomyxa filosa TaxID=46433 RepID=X6N0M7_RETFI|nr:hypothetical protein RFI_17602 [Reticulomyxa filosa]|eukprot:ETO19631.1 hypothetical protein RFI_17602 [Reticulomyxa filosa]